MLFGGIEAGGTKFVCAIGDDNGRLMDRTEIPTLAPSETMAEVIRFFRGRGLAAMGIGSFGPIDVNEESDTYGNITTTPKPGWKDYPFVETIRKATNLPVGFNTDVNGAALAEATLGAAKGLDSCLYITVGTGIGAGAVVEGQLLKGLSHPEMGHILIRRHPDDPYSGNCPYHGDCLEGMASGPAIMDRWGKPAGQLAENQAVWELEAHYLAQALAQYILILSPKKIIIGGGVSKQKQIFPLIHREVAGILNGYVALPELEAGISDFIVRPQLGDEAGIIGALLLAKQAFQQESNEKSPSL